MHAARDSTQTAWQPVLESRTPVDRDAPVVVRKLATRGAPTRGGAEVRGPGQRRLGTGAVYPGGWYPGRARGDSPRAAAARARALAALEARGREPVLRLQLAE